MLKDRYKKAYKKIKEARNILLVTHERPDGDALSSTCALIDLLESLNRKYFAYCLNTPPSQFNFLPWIDKFKSNKNELNFSEFDLIIVLDCGQKNRTKIDSEIDTKKDSQYIIAFDHHPKIESYANLEIKLPKLSSTAEILYGFFKTNKIKINKNIANCILTGIMTDTGNLLYDVTTDKTVKIASKMLSFGARFPLILEGTWRNKTLEGMKLWGMAMKNLHINKKYNFAYSVLTNKDIKECKATEEELEGISGFLSNLQGAKGLVFLREREKGTIRGSLRGIHPNIDISRLAQKLGGGHAKASGFSIEGHIEKTANSWKII